MHRYLTPPLHLQCNEVYFSLLCSMWRSMLSRKNNKEKRVHGCAILILKMWRCDISIETVISTDFSTLNLTALNMKTKGCLKGVSKDDLPFIQWLVLFCYINLGKRVQNCGPWNFLCPPPPLIFLGGEIYFFLQN